MYATNQTPLTPTQPIRPQSPPPSTPLTTSLPYAGLMWPHGPALRHPAAPLLTSYALDGCPVDCGPQWTKVQLEQALQYGAHPSAKRPEALKCLIDETDKKVSKGFARIFKWVKLKNNIPKNLKISPVAVIPHKSRAFHCILDLSFQL